MSSKFQNLSFALSLLLSIYFFAFALPQKLQKHFSDQKTEKELTLAEKESIDPRNSASPPFATEAIKVKSSGEDPAEPHKELEAYLSVREEFERRFGHSFEDGWVNRKPITHPFNIPEGIRERVEFWIQIFGRYGKNQFVFHHKDNVALVYSTIDLSDLDPHVSGMSSSLAKKLRKQFIIEEKIRIRNLLKGLVKKVQHKKSLTAEERRLVTLFSKENHTPLSQASKTENIKIHGGFAHRFKRAITLSGKYMKEMENIFTMKGLPIELTRIPFIESAFNIRAKSSAKAVGMWQFIPQTGKRYLNIDEWTDERIDPILSTYAAAAHLKKEYQLLKSWPLAINAYNTGPGRMIKAKKQLKTDDISTIIKHFKDPGYQFYSRNYYPEFLAALYVYDNQEHFFGKIKKLAPIRYDFFSSPDEVNLNGLASLLDIDPRVMKQLNPALSDDILNGTYSLPAGYLVKVPKKMGALFAKTAFQHKRQIDRAQWHIVEEGETLKTISKYYGLSRSLLEKANHFLPHEQLTPGTVVKLPRDEGVAITSEEERKTLTR